MTETHDAITNFYNIKTFLHLNLKFIFNFIFKIRMFIELYSLLGAKKRVQVTKNSKINICKLSIFIECEIKPIFSKILSGIFSTLYVLFFTYHA